MGARASLYILSRRTVSVTRQRRLIWLFRDTDTCQAHFDSLLELNHHFKRASVGDKQFLDSAFACRSTLTARLDFATHGLQWPSKTSDSFPWIRLIQSVVFFLLVYILGCNTPQFHRNGCVDTIDSSHLSKSGATLTSIGRLSVISSFQRFWHQMKWTRSWPVQDSSLTNSAYRITLLCAHGSPNHHYATAYLTVSISHRPNSPQARRITLAMTTFSHLATKFAISLRKTLLTSTETLRARSTGLLIRLVTVSLFPVSPLSLLPKAAPLPSPA